MKPSSRFILRWFVCTLGIWIAAGFLRGELSYGGSFGVLVCAGLVLAIVNSIVKPVVILLSLPAVLLSLGFFLIIINGLMLMITSALYDPLHIEGFGAAMLAGLVIGLVNYLVTTIVEE